MQTFITDSHCTKKEHYGRFRAVKHDLLFENGFKCDHLECILKALICHFDTNIGVVTIKNP